MIIHCSKCNKDIGEIELGYFVSYVENGQIVRKFIADPAGPTVNYISENGLMSVRKRLDGSLGFECECGNDTRLAEAEKGIIGAKKPNKDEIEKVKENFKKYPVKQVKSKTKKSVAVEGFTKKLKTAREVAYYEL